MSAYFWDDPLAILYIIIAFLVLENLWGVYLMLRDIHVAYKTQQVPNVISPYLPQELYDKMRVYKIHKGWFTIVHNLFTAVILGVMELYFGFYAWLYGVAGKCDRVEEATSFLERHFGSKRLDSEQMNSEFQNRKTIIWHTWLVEKVRFPPAQCAVIKEWKDPITETLGTCYCSWHLKSCMAWQLIIRNRMTEAKCFCSQIKKTMDIVNCLVDSEVAQEKTLKDCSSPLAVLTEKVFDATDMLKKLNDLLELQEKRNRKYKRLCV
ncbi:GD25505 [Drosophila simulans]|uniref:GD25505 n=1 Tax=Drosophila simulans TaxID=7240 RepID=B4QII6_DROSI|nr:GD25505 [Drosophila simulans]